MEKGDGWIYKIVPEEGDLEVDCIPDDRTALAKGVGTVCIWEGYWEEHSVRIVEMGWGVVPKYQGRGFASLAVRLLLQMVERDTDQRWALSYTPLHHWTTLLRTAYVEDVGSD